jgi:hypothetical protein
MGSNCVSRLQRICGTAWSQIYIFVCQKLYGRMVIIMNTHEYCAKDKSPRPGVCVLYADLYCYVVTTVCVQSLNCKSFWMP